MFAYVGLYTLSGSSCYKVVAISVCSFDYSFVSKGSCLVGKGRECWVSYGILAFVNLFRITRGEPRCGFRPSIMLVWGMRLREVYVSSVYVIRYGYRFQGGGVDVLFAIPFMVVNDCNFAFVDVDSTRTVFPFLIIDVPF